MLCRNALNMHSCFRNKCLSFVCSPPLYSTCLTCVCVSYITHQVHSGGSVTQGHADPGGCVSGDLMIHPLQSDFLFFYAPGGPHANTLTVLILLGAAALCSCVTLSNKKKSVHQAISLFIVSLSPTVIHAFEKLCLE